MFGQDLRDTTRDFQIMSQNARRGTTLNDHIEDSFAIKYFKAFSFFFNSKLVRLCHRLSKILPSTPIYSFVSLTKLTSHLMRLLSTMTFSSIRRLREKKSASSRNLGTNFCALQVCYKFRPFLNYPRSAFAGGRNIQHSSHVFDSLGLRLDKLCDPDAFGLLHPRDVAWSFARSRRQFFFS